MVVKFCPSDELIKSISLLPPVVSSHATNMSLPETATFGLTESPVLLLNIVVVGGGGETTPGTVSFKPPAPNSSAPAAPPAPNSSAPAAPNPSVTLPNSPPNPPPNSPVTLPIAVSLPNGAVSLPNGAVSLLNGAVSLLNGAV